MLSSAVWYSKLASLAGLEIDIGEGTWRGKRTFEELSAIDLTGGDLKRYDMALEESMSVKNASIKFAGEYME